MLKKIIKISTAQLQSDLGIPRTYQCRLDQKRHLQVKKSKSIFLILPEDSAVTSSINSMLGGSAHSQHAVFFHPQITIIAVSL